ncbi:MAG TPA: PilZ domain-containing protein [Blastocatellia bacterium]|nr:PilZ domain-containing protein [Blastocatellia bacterium]
MWISVNPAGESHPSYVYDGVERRHKPRIYEAFFTIVRGTDADGKEFTANTLLDNISVSGLYLRLARRVDTGARLFVVIHLSTCSPDGGFAGRAALLGIVLRSEPRGDELWGLAMRFTRYRFL